MTIGDLMGKVVAGLRTRGLKYPFQAAVNELRHPRLAVTPHIRRALIRIRELFGSAGREEDIWSGDSLQFVYDLSVSPLTYDFASDLAVAEVERRARGLKSIDVIFLKGADSDIRQELPEYDALVDRDTRLFRFHNVVLPILRFLPSVSSYVVCGDRKVAKSLMAGRPERNLYPSDYRVFLPRQPSKRVIFEHAKAGASIWPMYSSTAKGRKFVAEFLDREAKGRLPVVITLRNYDHSPGRNSRNEAWLAFARELDHDVYAPIFVHDTETAMRPPPGDFSDEVICEAASWNLEIRVALFERAWLNLSVMHGPMELCWYIQPARYVVFLKVGASPQTEPAVFAQNGQTIGEDFDFCMPHQHIAWCEDSLENIRSEFERMREIIVRDPGSPPA